MQLSWEAIPTAYQNGIITGYMLSVTQLGVNSSIDTGTDETILEANTFSYEVRRLITNTIYNISLAALTSAGTGPKSSVQVSISSEGNLNIYLPGKIQTQNC